jgi:hypothetical protein
VFWRLLPRSYKVIKIWYPTSALFFLGFRLRFPRSCGPFINFNALAKQPEPGFEVVESFRPGYPRRQMALRGPASRGLIRRPAFDLPEIHQSGRSKERKERGKYKINKYYFTLPPTYWLYLLRRWRPLLCSTCSLISCVTDPLGNGAGRVKEPRWFQIFSIFDGVDDCMH